MQNGPLKNVSPRVCNERERDEYRRECALMPSPFPKFHLREALGPAEKLQSGIP